jgi:apolipoprotein D and lipocalin family protein
MLRLICAAALCLGLAACGERYRDEAVAMETVAAVDLARYAGRWYEVARFPVWFQEGCVAVTADYDLRPDGTVGVLNSCRQGALDGPVETAAATARSVDASNARLKVRFSRWIPIEGDYWVIFLDPDYSTAVVAVPSGSAGWILSRTPQIAPDKLEAARAALAAAGYDPSRLVPTPQPGG